MGWGLCISLYMPPGCLPWGLRAWAVLTWGWFAVLQKRGREAGIAVPWWWTWGTSSGPASLVGRQIPAGRISCCGWRTWVFLESILVGWVLFYKSDHFTLVFRLTCMKPLECLCQASPIVGSTFPSQGLPCLSGSCFSVYLMGG